MKKIIIFLLLICVGSTFIMAQDVMVPTTDTNYSVYRKGNTYHYGEQIMNKREYKDFLQNNHQAAYKQFQSGYNMYVAGWSLMSVGFAFDALAAVYLVCIPFANDGIGQAFLAAFSIYAAMAGLVFEIPGIPLLGVGYARMHKSVDTYNVSLPDKNPKPYLTLHSSTDGIGLALRF